jgi:hypothetical protein
MAVCEGENIQTVNMEREGTVLAQVSDCKYLVNVTLETEKGVELNQTCNKINGAEDTFWQQVTAKGLCMKGSINLWF